MPSAPVPLRAVVDTWIEVRASSGRLDKRRRMADLFAALDPRDLRLAASYLAGDVGRAPPGIGAALIEDAARAMGPARANGAGLTLREVDDVLAGLATVAGAGATRRRVELLAGLLARADRDEREFLAGLLLGELRQGALKALVIDALAQAAGVSAAVLRRAVMLAGSLGDVAEELRREGVAALDRVRLTPLVPVEPMLAATAGDLESTLADLGGEAAVEWKLDGVRVQLHRRGAEVRVFTRSLRDVTASAPELVELARALPAESVILDGEVVALGEDGRPLPFQDLMSRFSREAGRGAAGARRLDAVFFDALYVDGEPLVDRPDRERRAVLERVLPPERCIPRRLVRSAAEAEAVLRDALDQGHEGLVVKALDAPYAAGRRGGHWRKLKLAVTVDLVILAAEWGHGRRQGWLSNLHLGARDPREPGRFWMLGKTFKGLTDAMLRQLTEDLLALAIERGRHVVRVRPERVVEIAFDAIQRSPRYESGLALRFARVKRFRPDKTAPEATTIDEIRALAARGSV